MRESDPKETTEEQPRAACQRDDLRGGGVVSDIIDQGTITDRVERHKATQENDPQKAVGTATRREHD